MLNWFKKRFAPQRPPIHPPWRAGQYVTYFLERGDGSWTAMALRVRGQMEDGAWILSADFKTPSGECTAWLRSDPAAPEDAMDPVPGRVERIRGTRLSADAGVERLAQDPEMQTAMAMNLLLVRRFRSVEEALQGDPREVHYPCGIDQAHLLVTPGPGYQKHHDLNPRVMLTGVACLSIDGGKNPITVTSFGWSDPQGSMPDTYDDFVDFSRPKHVDHEAFSLTYPATWFLRPGEHKKSRLQTIEHFTQLGGNTCSTTLSVTLTRGAPDHVTAERDAILERMRKLSQGADQNFRPRTTDAPVLSGDAEAFSFDFVDRAIDGFSVNGVFRAGAGDRLAHVILFGCVARANPRRDPTLAQMRSAFRAIVESFQFT